MIKVTINECRAGGEPKIFDGAAGSKVARVPIVHNMQSNENGTARQESRWFQAVMFGPAARFAEEHIHKGTKLHIEDGELHYGRPYTDKEGVTRNPDELHIIPGRAKIELAEAAGSRQDRGGEPDPAA